MTFSKILIQNKYICITFVVVRVRCHLWFINDKKQLCQYKSCASHKVTMSVIDQQVLISLGLYLWSTYARVNKHWACVTGSLLIYHAFLCCLHELKNLHYSKKAHRISSMSTYFFYLFRAAHICHKAHYVSLAKSTPSAYQWDLRDPGWEQESQTEDVNNHLK